MAVKHAVLARMVIIWIVVKMQWMRFVWNAPLEMRSMLSWIARGKIKGKNFHGHALISQITAFKIRLLIQLAGLNRIAINAGVGLD